MLPASLIPCRSAHLVVFILVLEHPTHGADHRSHLGRIVQKKASARVINQLRNREPPGGNGGAPEISGFDDYQRSNIAPCRMYDRTDTTENLLDSAHIRRESPFVRIQQNSLRARLQDRMASRQRQLDVASA